MHDGDDIQVCITDGYFIGHLVVGTVLNAANGLITYMDPHSDNTAPKDIMTHVEEIKPEDYIWDKYQKIWTLYIGPR